MDIIIKVDPDVYEKFCIALQFAKEDECEIFDNCMRWYIKKSLKVLEKKDNKNTASKHRHSEDTFYKKAVRKIPRWASKPSQYNHKIIKAYFYSIHIAGEASMKMMESLCNDKDNANLYVPSFKSNYAQMKIDNVSSHGKVFEDNGYTVWIWEEVEDILLMYKSKFYDGEL